MVVAHEMKILQYLLQKVHQKFTLPSKEAGWLEIGDLEASVVQQLYKTTDGGNTWKLMRWNYPDTAYYSWQFITDKIGWIATFPNALILHTINGGENWENYNTPESFISISFIDSLTGWGASSGRNL